MIIDIVSIIILLASALISFLRGFIREILTIIGVVGGIIAAYLGAPYLTPYMRVWMGVEEGVEPERLLGIIPLNLVSDTVSYGSIFLLVVIILSIISHKLSEKLKSMGLGAIDRTFGVIFGLTRGVLLLGLLYLPFHLLLDTKTKENWFAESHTHMYLETVSSALASALPQQAIEKIPEENNKKSPKIKKAFSAREKLEHIDLLKKEAKDLFSQEKKSKDQEGYSSEFRNDMNQLIEQETQDE